MNSPKNILTKSESIDGKYTIHFFIKKGSHAETYRVKDKDGRTKFLKLFQLSKLHRTQFDGEGNIKEIQFLKSIKHPNVVKYMDSGEWAQRKSTLCLSRA
jgi:transitional endoplasmic reticulum ATPase